MGRRRGERQERLVGEDGRVEEIWKRDREERRSEEEEKSEESAEVEDVWTRGLASKI